MVVVGSGVLSSMGTTGTTQLTDKVDSPHSGLFKALHAMSQGNLALDFGGTDSAGNFGFSHTYTAPSTPNGWRVVVQGGRILNEGQIKEVTDSGTIDLNQLGSGTLYHWIVVLNGAVIPSVIMGTVDSVVPDLTAQATPISLIKVQSTDTSGDLATQFFTTTKQSNSVSIGYDDSAEYKEAMSITGNVDRTTFFNNYANADIRFILADNTADEVFEIKTDDDADGLLTPSATVFSVNGLGATTIAGTLTLSSVAAAGTDTDKFLVLDGSGNVDYRTGTQVLSDIGGGTSSVAALNDLSDVSYSSGDLTITSLDKIVYANGGNAELSVVASGSGTVGRDLTITAGSTTAASGDTDGGDLILKSGLADGTGSSFIGFHTSTATSDDAVAERMRIHTNGYVGIGTTAPSAPLHIVDSGTDDTLRLESTDDGANLAPDLVFKRTTATPVNGDLIGNIRFLSMNSDQDDGAGTEAEHEFADIYARVNDITTGSESGELYFRTFNAGTQRRRMDMSLLNTVFNEDGIDINFRVESDDETHMLFLDAGNNRISIGDSTDAPAATLEITNHATAGATGVPLLQLNSNDTDQQALDINAANIDGSVMVITADALTTASVLNISADALTTGTMFLLHSDSSDTSTRDLVHIHNDHASATGTTALDVENDSTGPVAKFEGNGALLANIGPPITTANTTSTGSGLNSRVTTVVVGNATYAPTVSDSGTLILFNHSGANVTLPSINNTTSVGVQFTVYNQTTSDITGQIAVSNSATINGDAATSHDDISTDKGATFVCNGNNTWIRIG